jgi:hypothetical protein
MADVNEERRRLLQAGALLVGAAPSFTFVTRANAWDVTPLDPASPAGLAYSNRCGGSQEHMALLGSLRSELAANPSVSSMSATCPICGCPVIASR